MDIIKSENINVEQIKEDILKMEDLIKKLDDAKSVDEAYAFIEEINKIRDTFLTQYWVSYIGFLLNVKDENFLASEKEFGTLEAEMENTKLKYFLSLTKTKFKDELIKLMGERPFAIAENESVLINDKIIDLRKEEKEWQRKYTKLISTAKVDFKGEEVRLVSLSKYFSSDDREERKLAYETRYNWFLENESVFDEIMDNLVQIRTKIANKLGFESYTDVGYIKMNRIGYGFEEVANFREQIKEFIVPLISELREQQKRRVEISDFEYYDAGVLFKDGNAKLNKSLAEIVDITDKMYKDLSPELHEIFVYLRENNLMDLESRDNKSAGGIATYLPDYKVPFIVSSYNGSNRIIGTMSHEFGHATQLYLSRDLTFHENRWPTFDICEIHSITLEFLIYDYLDLYFGKDTPKYKIEHLQSQIMMLGYEAAIDEFQHKLYDNPKMTPEQRKEEWKKLQKEYMPHVKEEHDYLKKGIMWFQQSHVFNSPFYYIDYALDIVCALSFYEKYKLDKEKCMKDYIEFCKTGGSKSLTDLIKDNDLKNPFEKGSLESVSKLLFDEIKEVEANLENNEDK